MEKYQFINPYNFMPLSAEKAHSITYDSKNKKEDVYTGVIEYSLLTKTPLFIPNTSSDNAFNTYKDDEEEKKRHKSYDFFSYSDLSEEKESSGEETPVIPGSEVRGMLRSNFEMLTNSCMSSLDEDMVLSKRTSEPYQPALIKRKEIGGKYVFELYKAENIRLPIEKPEKDEKKLTLDPCKIQESYIAKGKDKDFHEGDQVAFEQNGSKARSLRHAESRDNNRKKGYLLKGYPSENKKYCHIFALKNDQTNKRPLKIGLEKLEELECLLKEYGKNARCPYTDYLEQFKKFKNEKSYKYDYFPVFYSEINYSDGASYLMLSPASITREIYNRKIKEMIGNYNPCVSQDKICPACSLFGTVVQSNNGRKGWARTSKLRFSDLTFEGTTADDLFMEQVTLPPLSSPKLSNLEFYFSKPNGAVFWTHDYYIDTEGKIHKNDCGINGRKFYWHNMISKEEIKSDQPSSQNITIRPLDSGAMFEGKLYFQKVTKLELDLLIYVLNAGDGNDINQKKHGYKLGGAKPLGLGSIATSVNRVICREIIKNDNNIVRVENEYNKFRPLDFYVNTEEKIKNEFGVSEELLTNFNQMTRFDAVNGENLSYPTVEIKDENGYEWFVGNHVYYKDGKLELKKMPNKRKQMAYMKYINPMSKKLELVMEHKESKGTKEPFETGEYYGATVAKVISKNNEFFITVTVANLNGSIRLKKKEGDKFKLKINDKIVVRYSYRNKNEYIFECVGKQK